MGTFDGVHRRNLSRIVRILHLDGPQSRAALTAATELNRSTIGTLVAELADAGIAEERAPGPSRRAGRPSPMVALRPDLVAIAVNPEVDAIVIAAVGLDGEIPVRTRIDVDHIVSPEEVARIVADTITQWRDTDLKGFRLVGVGVAVPGLVRASDGLVRFAPHLEWTDAPLRELIHDTTGLPTVVGNDATCGVLAEHLFGAGRGVDDIVYLNGGASGIGGGLVIGGTLIHGVGGYAGEFGQNRPGIADSTDRRTPDGVVEDEVNRARLLAVVDLENVDEPTLRDALESSTDPAVEDELARQRRILATTLANAVNVLNPSMIVLGGFLATVAEHDPEALIAAVADHAMPAAFEGIELRVAALGENRLMRGAAELAFEDLLTAPDLNWHPTAQTPDAPQNLQAK